MRCTEEEKTIHHCGEGSSKGILFLDVEGGFGGSSRSLYYFIQNMNMERFSPVVIVRKMGPVVDKYKALGVPCFVLRNMPKFRPGRRKRPVSFGIFLFQVLRLYRVLPRIKEIIHRYHIKLVHVNHESLGLVGFIISKCFNVPWTCHIRTLLVPGFFARFVYRTINKYAKRIVFITDQNMVHFAALVGRSFDMRKMSVVYNVCPEFDEGVSPLPLLNNIRDRFKVLSLSNFSYNRGIDRIIEVAEELKKKGRRDFSFFLFGHSANRSLIHGRKGSYTDEMIRKVKEKELEEMVFFPGHTHEPERALAGADALIKLTREANPWGRDIIEGLMAGCPIITLGAYQGFVEHGVNGYIELEYDPARIADYLVQIRDNKGLADRIRISNREKARRLFDGKINAMKLEAVFNRLLGPNGFSNE
ncbi:MAG: glycosyltransferase family 4 protein [Deltaproteobacteria bacterium]|nr:glycosyltransferase family 4 protein [Deltaproteobacteria bacterium]